MLNFKKKHDSRVFSFFSWNTGVPEVSHEGEKKEMLPMRFIGCTRETFAKIRFVQRLRAETKDILFSSFRILASEDLRVSFPEVIKT